jgi:UDP-glucose 4-epimerase
MVTSVNKVIVTGCAGFIGSHLCERLLKEGYEVIGIDAITDYYSPKLKYYNLEILKRYPKFKFFKMDLAKDDLQLLPVPNVIFHLAAQPGVRESWGSNFEVYIERNLIATERLLERFKNYRRVKFIVSSSSSVYGNIAHGPLSEDYMPAPISPYGVTKLAMERLCYAYHINYDMPFIILRYFTVYGPRQRPDMAFHKFIASALQKRPIIIFGSGRQKRDFTYVDDVVEATVASLNLDAEFEIINIGTGNPVTLLEVIKLIEKILGENVEITFHPRQAGDVDQTWADISKARRLIRYSPKTSLEQGLKRQIEWQILALELNLL